MRVVNNIIHDTYGAGLGSTAATTSSLPTTRFIAWRSQPPDRVRMAARSCDGDGAGCQIAPRKVAGDRRSGDTAPIPNRTLLSTTTTCSSPAGYQEPVAALHGAWASDPPVGRTCRPRRTDDNLRIAGNVIWNGPADHAACRVGEDGGCLTANPTVMPPSCWPATHQHC